MGYYQKMKQAAKDVKAYEDLLALNLKNGFMAS